MTHYILRRHSVAGSQKNGKPTWTLTRMHPAPNKRCATPCRRHFGLGSTLCINIKNNSYSGSFLGLKRQNVPEKYQNMLFAVKELAQNLQPLQKRVQA